MTLMVMVLVTALATTVSVVAINNLQSSTRAQQAGSALNAAEAGIAQAMSYLRSAGVRDLRCAAGPGPNTCAPNTWGSEAAPKTVAIPGTGTQSYRVWIEPVAAYPLNNPGLYRIHSDGRAGGSAAREVTEDVGVSTSTLPMGVVARTFNGGGSASVTRQSIFSTGCVYDRDKVSVTGTDIALGIPAAVHSAQHITETNGTTHTCTTDGAIHLGGTRNNPTPRPCNTQYPYDQDILGGNLVGTTCAPALPSAAYTRYYGARNLDGDAAYEVDGSYIEDKTTLAHLYGVQESPLDQAELDQLRAVAQEQGNYWNSSTTWSSPDEANAVMFFDLGASDPGGTVNLNNVSGFGRDPNVSSADAACTTRSLAIVIVGGNAKMNSNVQLAASLFLVSPAPYGALTRANGTAGFIGTIYADSMNLVGNVDMSMDDCFLANVSPALLSLVAGSYRELDR